MINVLLILGILCFYGSTAFYFIKARNTGEIEAFEEDAEDKHSLSYLAEQVIVMFDEILQTDYSVLNLNKYETMKNERSRDTLRGALKLCAQGNISLKLFVRDYIKDLLQRRLGVTEDTIDLIIPFEQSSQLTAQDKFEILLFVYKEKYDYDALNKLIEENGFDQPKGDGSRAKFFVTGAEINALYDAAVKSGLELSFFDKLDIVSQRIYQMTYGLGAVDEIRDMNIDGLNCGTSGIPSTFYSYQTNPNTVSNDGELPAMAYNAIWVMHHGALLHLRCIGFGSERELERVTRLVYRYDNPGTLDAARGFIVNFSQDGCRVTAARPPFAESWMFFVRKFGTAGSSWQDAYPYKGINRLIELVYWLVIGQKNIAITGGQGVGKTSFLAKVVDFLPESAGIRIQEMAFELFLRKLYPWRNIASFRETTTVTAQSGIEFSKKTDGTASIFGEIAQAAVASLAIQMGESGSAQVYFTNHAKTSQELIDSFRNSMIEAAGFNNEELVERTVAKTLNFDIHLKYVNGVGRFIERVSMIVPRGAEDYPDVLEDAQMEYFYRRTDRQIFDVVDILKFENGEFVYTGAFTDKVREEMASVLAGTEKQAFLEFADRLEKEAVA